MELHEVKMVNPNVFMGMDVVKRWIFIFIKNNNSFNESNKLSQNNFRRPVLTDKNPHIEVRLYYLIKF